MSASYPASGPTRRAPASAWARPGTTPPIAKTLPSVVSVEALVAAAMIVVTMLDIANYVGELRDMPPKFIYFPMVGLCALVIFASSRLHFGRVRLAIVLYVGAYVVLNAFHGLMLAGDAAQIAWSRLQFIVLAFVIALTATTLARRQLAMVFSICASIIALSLLFDFLFPGTLYPGTTPGVVPGRVGGFFINPTKAGEAAVLAGLLAAPALGRRSALVLLLLTGAAVLVTFSRAAMVAWVFLAAFYWWAGLLGRNQLLAGAAVLGLLLAGGGLIGLLVDSRGLATVNALDIADRLNFLRTGNLHDDSGEERLFVLFQGFKLFSENVFVGAGAGATHLWEFAVAPHNQAVMMAAEYGLFGVIGWLGLIALVASGNYFGDRPRQLAAAGFVLLFSMSTHNMLDFPYWIVALFVMAMDYRAGVARRTSIAVPVSKAPVAESRY